VVDPEARAVDLPSESDAESDSTIAELFRANAAYISGLAIRILGRRDQAEDLVQDVFVEAMRAADQLRQPQRARRWLAVVAVRKARRRLRRQRLLGWLDRDDRPDYEELADPAVMSPRDRALLHQMYEVLDCLPARQRIAWVLRHVEGQSLGEVASLCGTSLATAKRHIAAAQSALERATGDE
jgi:RNA polymerase sigma-70 factor, ECF subfamily